MPYYYIILICVAVVGALYLIGGALIAIYAYNIGKRTNDQVLKHEIEVKNFDINLLDIPYESYFAQSRFGYRLHARLYMAEKPTNKFIVDLHGRHSSSISQLKYLHIFTEMGYNVFLPDHRYCGESGGMNITFGAYEKFDVMTWLTLLQKKFPQAEFAMFGESLGATTAILTTSMDSRIKALISYCGFADLSTLMKEITHTLAPRFLQIFLPSYKFVSFVCGIVLSRNNAEKSMQKIKIPTLIMHSYGDKLINISHAKKLAKANSKAETVYFESSEHACSYVKYPEIFKNAVQSFLAKNFPNEPSDGE